MLAQCDRWKALELFQYNLNWFQCIQPGFKQDLMGFEWFDTKFNRFKKDQGQNVL